MLLKKVSQLWQSGQNLSNQIQVKLIHKITLTEGIIYYCDLDVTLSSSPGFWHTVLIKEIILPLTAKLHPENKMWDRYRQTTNNGQFDFTMPFIMCILLCLLCLVEGTLDIFQFRGRQGNFKGDRYYGQDQYKLVFALFIIGYLGVNGTQWLGHWFRG